MSLDRKTWPSARTSCLAASMTACGWCTPASLRTTRSFSPVSRRSSHRTPKSNPTRLRWPFRPGRDPNKAALDVKNRVSQALSRLPSEVVSLGVTTQKQSPAFLTLITLISEGKYDPLYLRNYANIRVKDQLARIPGVGQIRLFGGGDYAMRVWLNPDQIASRGMTAGDVVRAIQEQNIQVSAGQLGAEPIKCGSHFLSAINAQGRLRTAQEFGDVVLKTGSDGEGVRRSHGPRIELGASDHTLAGQLDRDNTSIIGVFPA